MHLLARHRVTCVRRMVLQIARGDLANDLVKKEIDSLWQDKTEVRRVSLDDLDDGLEAPVEGGACMRCAC